MVRIGLNPSRLTFVERIIGEQIAIAFVNTRLLFFHNYQRPVVLFSILILTHLLSLGIRAQGKLVAIEKQLQGLTTSKEVTCIRQRTRPKVVVNMVLLDGDRLISDSRALTVRVSCGGSGITLSAPFRLRFITTKLKTCYVGYWSQGGEMNLQASGPTGVLVGEAKMESRRTQYGIKVSGTGNRLTREWLVYEGEVSVQPSKRSASKTVKEGEKLVTKGNNAPSAQKITEADFDQAAAAYAKIDVSQTKIPDIYDRWAAYVGLKDVHDWVLKKPRDEDAQSRLVETQKSLGIPADPTPTPTPLPPEQGALFELLNQGKYQEAITGFGQRVQENRANSRDYYGLALAYVPDRDWTKSALNAQRALDLDETNRLLSDAERLNSMRMAAVENLDKLFDLLSQGDYKEPMRIFMERVVNAVADSRDYYGLALGSERLGVNDRAIAFAQLALKIEKIDGRLAKKDQADCERITKLQSQEITNRELLSGHVTLEPDTKTSTTFSITKTCGIKHTLRFTLENLPFVSVLPDAEFKVVGGEHAEVGFLFDTTGMKAGSYSGEIRFACLDCSDRCSSIRESLPLEVKIKERPTKSKNDQSQIQPLDEQAVLFELLRQNIYPEAVTGFDRRVKEKRADSRDYYGLALAYEKLKNNKRAASYANEALSFNQNDHRLSKEEQNDCRRIAERNGN